MAARKDDLPPLRWQDQGDETMRIAPDAPRRPALRYYGGKWNLAPWIISHFPPHKNYVEPCGGAASVLLQKPRSPLETYNDLDGNVVNFFRVLRDDKDELLRRVSLTPWAREEYEGCVDVTTGDEIERARKFFVRACMSFNGAVSDNKQAYGWRHTLDFDMRASPALDMANNTLAQIAARLIGVQIENRKYQDVIERFNNSQALIYFDPPYVQELRNKNFWYLFDWMLEQHIEAAGILRDCQGYIVISGYACPLYADLYEAHGWVRRDKEAQTNSGGKRIESLWLSPRTWQALQDGAGLPLFSLSEATEPQP